MNRPQSGRDVSRLAGLLLAAVLATGAAHAQQRAQALSLRRAAGMGLDLHVAGHQSRIEDLFTAGLPTLQRR